MMGMLIQLMIENIDQCSKDYGDIVQVFCFGYVDIVYYLKYGICDYCGGGWFSVWEIVVWVVVGVVVQVVLCEFVFVLCIIGYMVQMGDLYLDCVKFDLKEIGNNLFFLFDVDVVLVWEDYLNVICKDQNSVGVVIEVLIWGCLVGLGVLVYVKLDIDFVVVMMLINVVKGVEIGEGMVVVVLIGMENVDEICMGNDGLCFLLNYVGGILGGILIGQDILVCFVVKLISLILMLCCMINQKGEDIELIIKGCYDFCVGICVVLIVEVMVVCVILDQFMMDCV